MMMSKILHNSGRRGARASSSYPYIKGGALHDDDEQLLQTLCKKGQLDRALDVLSRMHTSPSDNTYMSLLKTCIKSKSPTHAKQLQAHLAGHRTTLTGFLGGYLVITLAKCGAIDNACLVSARLPHRTVFSWTAIITAYAECGRGLEALKMHQFMQEDGVEPNEYTFVSLFKACGSILDLGQGKKLHAEARSKGFTLDIFVGNTLVSMYGKCGAVKEAEDVFVALHQRNIVSWNAMLSAYVEQGQGEKALQVYRQMQEEGFSPNQLTLVIALQACSTVAEKEEAIVVKEQSIKVMSLEIGQALHADAHTKDVAMNISFCTALLSMYSKCGAIQEAEAVFSTLSQHDIISWTAMLSAYIQRGKEQKALLSYAQMHKECICPDQHTLVFALQACGILAEKEAAIHMEGRSSKAMSLKIGLALHMDARTKGFASDVFVGTALLSMYSKCGCAVEGEDVFCALSHRDIVSWNAMLSSYVEQGKAEKAVQLYRQMQEESVSPDQQTIMFALLACGIFAENEEALMVEGQSIKVMSQEIGQALHAAACVKGFGSDVFFDTVLLDMYCKCGAIVEAEDIFCAMPHHDVVSWNVMLSAYLDKGQGEKALQLYKQMQKECVILDDGTLICILQACSQAGNLKICKQVHFNVVSALYDRIPAMAATIIHAYGNCASMVDAEAIFDEIREHDSVSWNACIAGHAGEGNSVASLHMFEKLKAAGIKPDEVTLASVLSSCTHTGFVVQGLEYIESMSRDCNLTLGLKHYGIMIDLLGRAGDFKRIENMLGRMQMQADLTVWLCLLGACHTHGNLKLAKQAFDHAVRLQPKQATAYVLMSNIYANAGLQECAAKVENSRQEVWPELD